MGLFNKKRQKNILAELKCPMEGCSFTSSDSSMLKRHIEWKHPELMNIEKDDSKKMYKQKAMKI